MENAQGLFVVTSHSAEYIRTWHSPPLVLPSPGESEHRTAQVLLAAGSGPARVATCQHALQHAPGSSSRNLRLLTRALALLRPGELSTLRVTNPAVFPVVVLALQRSERAAAPTRTPPPVTSQPALKDAAPEPLRSLGWPKNWGKNTAFALGLHGDQFTRFREWRRGEASALALVERCSGTLKELDCRVRWSEDKWNDALARCTRLESLTHAYSFSPATWLGLSQLHTVLRVPLRAVSTAALAAALPRLHTLGLTADADTPAASTAGFFETLFPRLRAFHFRGAEWPADDTTIAAPSEAVPMLRELTWDSRHVVRGFLGVQPVVFAAPAGIIAIYAAARSDSDADRGPLSRVRVLRCFNEIRDAPDVAAVLRAAPELRVSHVGNVWRQLAWRNDPAFTGLIHHNLRFLRFTHGFGVTEEKLLFAAEFDKLRAHHFPRLRALTLEQQTLLEEEEDLA
jgi:hypothetical protein